MATPTAPIRPRDLPQIAPSVCFPCHPTGPTSGVGLCHLHAGSRSGIVSELSEMVKPGWFLLTVAAMQRGGAHINGVIPLRRLPALGKIL
ncbi:hypothetical protein GW17_00035174 [Ensete ventricosum]|nr:hypothetical protein GW17_00035174 [Ensete ventricosum]